MHPLLLLTGLLACAHRSWTPDWIEGPHSTRLPLYKDGEAGEKIFVEADPGDGIRRLFLVDTGSPVTVIHADLAATMGLETTLTGGRLLGLAGAVPWRKAVLPSLRLGRIQLRDVEVAVDVAGVPTQVGGAPVAGLIGNNIWKNFQVVLDYPAGEARLLAPGTLPAPEGSRPLYFNGQHILTAVTLLAESEGRPRRKELMMEVDTGSSGLVLFGDAGGELADLATSGEELVLGVGADADAPRASFLVPTQRISLMGVEAGGARLEEPLTAVWREADAMSPGFSAAGMRGLLGHQVLDGYRVLLDYPGQRIALEQSERRPGLHDVHDSELARLRGLGIRKHRLEVAELRLWQDDLEGARRLIQRELRADPESPRARVWMARLLREAGEPEAALSLTEEMGPADLVDQDELIATVQALRLADRAPAALALARAAAEIAAEEPQPWVALADALAGEGDLEGARHALNEANRLAEDPDGELLRRAMLARAEGDLYGAIAHLRRWLQLAPGDGLASWFYADLAADSELAELALRDLASARARLHLSEAPLDFQAASLRRLGEASQAEALARQGLLRDCAGLETGLDRENCEAWYRAVGGFDLAGAAERIEEVLALKPAQVEYLDTLSAVREARGDPGGAREAAVAALRLAPDDAYLLWQADRHGLLWAPRWRVDATPLDDSTTSRR